MYFTAIGLIFLFLIAAFVHGKFFSKPDTMSPSNSDRKYVRDRAKQVVRLGQDNYSKMFDSVEDAALDSGLSSPFAEMVLNEEIDSLIAEQKGWSEITDVDRLNNAFSKLGKLGYHVGKGLIDDPGHEISLAKKADKLSKKQGKQCPGYIFYYFENVEDLIVNGGSIDFWYGIPRRKTSQEEELRVVSDLNAALKAQGLTPEWEGTPKSHLTLPINWQVRWEESRAKRD